MIENQQGVTMTTSLVSPNTRAHLGSNSRALEALLVEDDSSGSYHRDEPLSDKVIGLREWGAGRLFPLRAPQHARDIMAADMTALQSTRSDLAIMTDRAVEIVYESRSWRIKDWGGIANLKQDGRPTREVSLMPGTEVTIAGRTFIAESARSIALRNFCSRLLGWSDDRIAVVDHALRAIRLAGARRAPLVLTGTGDLVPVAHVIHRYTFGDNVPFIVSDPRRTNTSATVRSPANYVSGMEAFRRASGGTLCVRARRLPRDFGEVLNALRAPESGVQLTICSSKAVIPSAAQIDIPLLDARHSELRRIVSEYIEDAIHVLHAPDDCLGTQDIEGILNHSTFGAELTISGIEKATLRAVALKMTGDLTKAARLLGMARVSLERWIRRRNGDL